MATLEERLQAFHEDLDEELGRTVAEKDKDPASLCFRAVHEHNLADLDAALAHLEEWTVVDRASQYRPRAALVECLISGFVAGALRLLRDERSQPERVVVIQLAINYRQVAVLQELLPFHAAKVRGALVSQAYHQCQLEDDPGGLDVIRLLRARLALMAAPQDKVLLLLNEDYPLLWWAVLAGGPVLWASHSALPAVTYCRAQDTFRAALTAAVGRDLTGYLARAL